MPLRSHAQALAYSLAEATRRLGTERVVSMDGRTGTLSRVYAEGGSVMVEVVTDKGTVSEAAGFWQRSSLL